MVKSRFSKVVRSCCIWARKVKIDALGAQARSNVTQWLFAAPASVEAASQPWSFYNPLATRRKPRAQIL